MGYSLVQMIRAIFQSDNGLNEHEKIVMTCLAQHADEQGTCFPSISLVAKECSVSRRTVLRAIDGLTKKGWVIVQKRNGCVTIYTCRIPSVTSVSQTPESDSHQCLTDTGASQSQDQCLTVTGSPVSDSHRCLTDTGPVTHRHRTSDSQAPEDTQEVNKYAAAAIYKEHQQQENIVTAFERCFGRFPSSYQLEVFESYIQDGLDERLVIRAMEKAAIDGKGPRYAEAILKDWLAKGIRTVEQAEREEREWREKVVPMRRTSPEQPTQRQTLPKLTPEEIERIVAEDRRRLEEMWKNAKIAHWILEREKRRAMNQNAGAAAQ